MRMAAQIISWLSLVLLVLPSILFLSGTMDLQQVKWTMLIATFIWFVAAPFWMWKEK